MVFIKFDVHNDNNDISYHCLVPVLVSDCSLAHICLLYVVYISYTPLHHLIFYTAFFNPDKPPPQHEHFKNNELHVIRKKTKAVSVINLVVGASS